MFYMLLWWDVVIAISHAVWVKIYGRNNMYTKYMWFWRNLQKLLFLPYLFNLIAGNMANTIVQQRKTTSKLRFLIGPGTIHFSSKNRILSRDPISLKSKKIYLFFITELSSILFYLGCRIRILQNDQALAAPNNWKWTNSEISIKKMIEPYNNLSTKIGCKNRHTMVFFSVSAFILPW